MTAAVLGGAALFLASVALIVAAGLFLRARVGGRVTARAARRLVARGRRAVSRGADHGAWLGCVDYGHRFYVFVEDLALVLPPRPGKSPELADRILSHPGAVSAISTRPDLYELGDEGEAS